MQIDFEKVVAEFHKAVDYKADNELRTTLIEEEIAEVIEAFAHLLKELSDLAYVLAGGAVAGEEATYSPKDILLALEVYEGIEDSFGSKIMIEAFNRVHESNMSKLVDGKPWRRADGKILKGPNYKEPDLISLVRSELG